MARRGIDQESLDLILQIQRDEVNQRLLEAHGDGGDEHVALRMHLEELEGLSSTQNDIDIPQRERHPGNDTTQAQMINSPPPTPLSSQSSSLGSSRSTPTWNQLQVRFQDGEPVQHSVRVAAQPEALLERRGDTGGTRKRPFSSMECNATGDDINTGSHRVKRFYTSASLPSAPDTVSVRQVKRDIPEAKPTKVEKREDESLDFLFGSPGSRNLASAANATLAGYGTISNPPDHLIKTERRHDVNPHSSIGSQTSPATVLSTVPNSARPATVQFIRGRPQECTACGDIVQTRLAAHGSCLHNYCRPCMRKLWTDALTDDGAFPPRCCGEPISIENAKKVLTKTMLAKVQAKQTEFDTADKTYCYSCGRFIPTAHITDGNCSTCPHCKHATCTTCKTKYHEGMDCPDDKGTRDVLHLASTLGWQKCSRCSRMVEREYGCNHMTCRCGNEFCYECGGPWMNCHCRRETLWR